MKTPVLNLILIVFLFCSVWAVEVITPAQTEDAQQAEKNAENNKANNASQKQSIEERREELKKKHEKKKRAREARARSANPVSSDTTIVAPLTNEAIKEERREDRTRR